MLWFLVLFSWQTQGPAEAEVADVIHRFYAAVEQRDWPALRATLTRDWVLFTPVAAKLNADELIEGWQQNAPKIKAVIQRIQVRFSADRTMAVATYEQWAEYDWKKRNADQKGLLTSVLVQENGVWKMAHTHRTTTRAEVYRE